MEVVSSCPMNALGFVWQMSSGKFAQTIVVKATYLLEPGHAKLAPPSQWEPTHEQDQFVSPQQCVLFAPTDRVPFKRRVDVMLVGHAYAPGKQPVRSLVAKIDVGPFSKSIAVFCDRGFRSSNDALIEGPRFTKMPLDWTRAAGGSGTTNPIGLGASSTPNSFGLISMPNLQPVKTVVVKGSDSIAPIGYGPIPASWPGRTQRVAHLGDKFTPAGWDERPLPENFDFEYFQAAPPDQQLGEFRPDAALVLENLHPVHAHLATRLPGIYPRAVVHRASGEREHVTLVADTLWIDTDRGICCVVWRGSIGLRHPTEAGLIGVVLVEPVIESTDDLVVETIPEGLVNEEELASMTMIAPFGTNPKGPTMPFVETNAAERPANPVRSRDDGALPFGPSGLSAVPPAPIGMGQITLPAQNPTSSPTIKDMRDIVSPAAPDSSTSATTSSTDQSIGDAIASSAPTTIRDATTSVVDSLSGTNSHPEPSTERTNDATDETLQAAGALPWNPSLNDLEVSSVGTNGVAEPSREMLQLLWYDADSMARMRRVPAWNQVFAARRTQDARDVKEASDRGEPEGPNDVFEVLTKAPRADVNGVRETLEGAIADDGKFVPPMVLVAGELEVPFDELEALKAAMSTVLPVIAPGDEQLEAAVTVAKNFVQTPGLSASPVVSEGLTSRIRDAFVKEKKALPVDYLDTQVERVLISGRHYQKREVFGGMYVRCLVWLSGETSALVGYLPADVAKKLPMWRRFRARVIAEVHPAQDQYEVSRKALKVVGVGRTSWSS